MVLDFALNPFKKGKHSPIEGVRKVETNTDPLVNKALEQYINLPFIPRGSHPNLPYIKIMKLEKIILEPNQITNLFNYIFEKKLDQERWAVSRFVTGYYLSVLVNNSFEAGHNDFLINSYNADQFCPFYNLGGHENHPIKIKINGDVEDFVAYGSAYLDITINGNMGTDGFGYGKHNNVVVNGYVGEDFGFNSSDSTYLITGTKNIGKTFGNYSKDSTYKTHNKKLYNKMKKIVPDSNTIQLLDQNGEVLKEEKK